MKTFYSGNNISSRLLSLLFLICIGHLSNAQTNSLHLKCFIEGYMNGIHTMQPVLYNQGQPSASGDCDTIVIELHDILFPYNTLCQSKSVLNQNGNAICNFPNINGSYYIAVKHRNAVETWSANPVNFVSGTAVSYDFTSAASQAYGGNQVQVAQGVWAFYSGDIVTDENVDLADLMALDVDILDFAYGYLSTDINGDGNIDMLDAPILQANVSSFTYAFHP